MWTDTFIGDTIKGMNEQKKKRYNHIIFFMMWLAYTAVTLLLFHRQTVHYGGKYESDISPYVLYMQGINVGYEYPYPIMFWVGKVFSLVFAPELALALAVTELNCLTPLLLKGFWDSYLERRRFLKEKGEGSLEASRKTKHPLLQALVSNLLLFTSLFVSMLYFPLTGWLGGEEGSVSAFAEAGIVNRYVGIFSPNPFHNATYLAARGFSVAAFFLFLEILQRDEKTDIFQAKGSALDRSKSTYLLYGAFSLSLLLTTMTKPSFTLGFVASAGLVILYRWLKSGLVKNWKRYVTIGFLFIPTFAALLYQYSGVFTGANALGEEQGIGFGFLTAWHTAVKNVPLAILLGIAFPLIVLLFHIKTLWKNPMFGFSWLMMVINLGMMALLYEKGFRLGHLNFAWGYMCGQFFVFLSSLMLIYQETREQIGRRYVAGVSQSTKAVEADENDRRNDTAGRNLGKILILLIEWSIFAMHLLCGILYFVDIMQGGKFV